MPLEEPVGEVGALAELGDTQFDRAHPCVPRSFPVAAAPVPPSWAWASVARVAERIDLGAHERLDERFEQRAHEIRVSLGQVLWHQGNEDRRRWWPSW